MNSSLRSIVHRAQQLAGFGRTIEYRRGVRSTTLSAVIGETVFRVDTPEDGTYIDREDRDYLVRATELAFDGQRIEPEAGDLIVDGGDVFMVAAPEGEPVARDSGHAHGTHRVLRIHARRQA